MRLRHLVTIGPRPPIGTELHPDANVTFVPMEAIADGLGGLDISQTRPFSEVVSGSYNYFAEGDLLLAKVTPCFENGKKALAQSLSNGIGYATSEVHVIRPGVDRIHPKYLFYLLCSEDFRAGGIASMTGAGGLRRVSDAAVLNYQPSVTNLPTQKAIADFLDRETARIDQLIEKKQRMVEVLGEKLAAQLQYTVLAGAKLSRNPEGDWLSDLSNDWRLFPIKHMVRIVGGATPSKEREDYWIGPIPWVSPKDMKRDTISVTSHCISEMALANSPVSIVPKGAVLIVVRGMILARLVPVCRLGCNATINQDMKALTSRGNIISNHYLHRMLQGFQDVIMSFVDEAAHGTKTLRSDRFFSLKFPVPPFELQTNLVVEYDKQKRLMDAIIEKIESSIYRLREFRSALITAAVTGQIDVSTWSKKGMTERRFDQIEEATNA